MTLYDLPAPAKLNLFLHVVGRRPDGYHCLESVFRLVSLADTISIELRTDGVISRASSIADQIPEAGDLAVRAALALQAATGSSLGAHLVIHKRVPTGGGLGGGSSDAATVLLALNRLWRTGLRREALMRLGLQLGADVPFFLFGQNAFVQGVGEQLVPVSLPDMSYIIFCPQISVPTVAVFTDPDLTRNTEPVKIEDFSGHDRFIAASQKNPGPSDALWRSGVSGDGFGNNDLEDVAVRLFPAVGQAKDWLAAQGISARMTGSGSCFFSEFETPAVAEFARRALTDKMSAVAQSDQGGELSLFRSISACDGLPSHPLHHWAVD